jgi:putative DNA primase/helicase
VEGRWILKKPDGWLKVPYRLPEILEALAKSRSVDVFIPEGEKDADTLAALGLVVTTSSEGATPTWAKTGKWTPELNRWFYGARRAFILEDNDEIGRAFACEKARALDGIVPDIRIVSFPDVPEREDVTYWLKEHTKEQLLERCEAAPRWEGGATLQSVRASAVTQRAVTWLWADRFALGKLGILAGLPDEGKSLITDYLAARVTRELSWPNGEGKAPQGNVILLTAEDDPEDTVVPRLVAAGADLDRIEIVQMVRERSDKDGREQERMFNLARDLPLLRRKIEEFGSVRVILIDPVTAYVGTSKTVDIFRDSDVRAVLTPLVHLTRELRIAIIVVMHFNKKIDVTNALLRISNSLAFGGVARHVFSITDDPESGRKLMARAKNNLAAKADNKTLAFHFDERETGTDPDTGARIKAPFIVWEPGYVDVSATEALSAAAESKSPGQRDKAKELLRAILGGGPMRMKEVEEAAKAHLIAKRTLERAKDEMGIATRRTRKDEYENLGKGWVWQLPESG